MAILVSVNTLFSNRIEALLDLLLYRLSKKPTSPFTERLVIVPGSRMKSWLQQKIAEDPKLGTTLGITLLPFEEALYYLKNKFINSDKKIPSLSDLCCLIEGEFATLSLKDLEDPFLSSWIQGTNKKKLYLTETLAHLFQKYGRFSPYTLSGWQKSLWERLYHPESYWMFPYEAFSNPLEKTPPLLEIDLFGFTFFSHLEYSFLKRISEKMEVHFYLLSPCLHFWSDLATEKEKRYFLKQAPIHSLNTLNELLSDTNPLLANFGKMGREMAKELELAGDESLNAYVVPEETLFEEAYELFEEAALVTDEKATVLRQLQTDLLFLRNPKTTEPLPLKEGDRSLELHTLSNKTREIECLRDLILRLNQEGIQDIVVMAPNISLYEPYIDAYFDDLPYTLLDRAPPKTTPLIALLEFYEDPANNDFLSLIEGGPFDREEKLILLNEVKSENLYQKGIRSIIERMMSTKCEITKLDLWDKTALFIETIKKGEPPASGSISTFTAWLETLNVDIPESLIETFKVKGERLLKPISYTLFKKLLIQSLTKQQDKRGESHLGEIRFSSLAPMRLIPAQAILLLGMKEGALPRIEFKHPLDLSNGDFAPTLGDFDRTLFLETLLSAREHLFILWSESDQPCRLVEELTTYIKSAFSGNLNHYIHPLTSYDPVYFSGNYPFKTYSQNAYQAALSLRSKPISIKKSGPLLKKNLSPLLKIQDLKKLLKNPLKYYQEAQGVKTVFREDREETLPFELSALEKWSILKSTLEGKLLDTPMDTQNNDLFSLIKQELKEEEKEKIIPFQEKYGLFNLEKRFIPPTEALPLYGEIPFVTQDGLVVMGEKGVEKFMEALPELLLLQKDDPAKNKLYFTKKGSDKTVNLDPVPLLQNLIAYASVAKTKPFPFVPKAIKPLLKKDVQELARALEPYGLSKQADTIMNAYFEEAQRLFGSIEELL